MAPVLAALAQRGIIGGLDLTESYPELGHVMLVCATETKTDADIEKYASAVADIIQSRGVRPARVGAIVKEEHLQPQLPQREPLIFQLSRPGRGAASQFPPGSGPCDIPSSLRRTQAPALPAVSELQVVRHFTRLSR